jgi:8-oxo-dGTP pyrophosphatase MutT (NUDIX family)
VGVSDVDKSKPREAASVILMREQQETVEVYLLRRHRKASFMSSSFVFPGGISEGPEEEARANAARELFEEAGVLLTREATDAASRAAWRKRVNEDKVSLHEILTAEGLHLDLDAMHYFAHWITPSVEPRRYSARFFVARMPEEQSASPDNRETVDEVWVSPKDAIERSAELRLPPPQLRTFYELLEPCEGGFAGVVTASRARAAHPAPILPRGCAVDGGIALLLPWDPDYESKGGGEAHPLPADHPLAVGRSRFVLEDGAWIHVHGREP